MSRRFASSGYNCWLFRMHNSKRSTEGKGSGMKKWNKLVKMMDCGMRSTTASKTLKMMKNESDLVRFTLCRFLLIIEDLRDLPIFRSLALFQPHFNDQYASHRPFPIPTKLFLLTMISRDALILSHQQHTLYKLEHSIPSPKSSHIDPINHHNHTHPLLWAVS